MTQSTGKGFLENDFRVFYLKDMPPSSIPMHYHDFRKILVLIDGTIGYAVEEKKYSMHPGDVMLVEAGSMHHPILTETAVYERLMIGLSEEYFAARPGLDELFVRAAKNCRHMLKVQPKERQRILSMAAGLTDAACSESRFPTLLQQSRMNEFLIELNDIAVASMEMADKLPTENDSISAAISYINDHLDGDLSAGRIAERVHLTESYLKHLFKKETGKTLRNYIMDKRLFISQSYLEKGYSAAEACTLSGFTSYSSFYRAYVDRYEISPRSISEQQCFTGRTPAE